MLKENYLKKCFLLLIFEFFKFLSYFYIFLYYFQLVYAFHYFKKENLYFLILNELYLNCKAFKSFFQ